MSFGLPRGLRDIGPEEIQAAENVRQVFIDTCRLFDYPLMEPSTVELIETLEAKSGPGIREEIYFFKDKSDRELGRGACHLRLHDKSKKARSLRILPILFCKWTLDNSLHLLR